MSLKENLQKKFCLWYWSKKHGKREYGNFSISSGGLQPDHLLIILPSNFEDFDIARLVVEPLVTRLNPKQISLLVRENFRSWLQLERKTKLIVFDPMKKDFWGLPAERLKREVHELQADMVIDLTPGFCLYTAALAAASDAPLRMALDYEHAAKFYNLLVSPTTDKSLFERYELLLQYI